MITPMEVFPVDLRTDPKVTNLSKVKDMLIETEQDKKKVFDYSLKHFYTTAQVPVALNMIDTMKDFSYVNEEMDMFINSGLSRVFINHEGSVVGVHLYSGWKADKNYPVFNVPIQEWLNAGNEIATEFGQSDAHRALIWRNYQLNYMYHFGQCLARKEDKPYLIYPSLVFITPEYRKLNLINNVFDYLPWTGSAHIVSCTVGTFKGYPDYVRKNSGGKVKVEEVDSVNYADLRLIMEDGRNAFEHLKDKGDITLITIN